MELTVPMESAKPIAVCVQLCPLRYTAMKGPKPVWMLATKRLNESRPRRPADEFDGQRARARCAHGGTVDGCRPAAAGAGAVAGG